MAFYRMASGSCLKHYFRQGIRLYTTGSGNIMGIRERLLDEVKTSMKNKDSFRSITLRSVLSEVYAADKVSASKISSSAIISIIRKAAQRRNESATQFMKASRLDLVEREQREAEILAAFLPPLMSESEIDGVLRDVFAEGHPNSLGKLLQGFYAKVDKSVVEPVLVKKRAENLLKLK